MKFSIPAFVLTFLLAAIFCIRQIGEADVWWQIRTGEYILEHGEVPKVDVFSYTYNGAPWFNVKWATEVIMAEIMHWLGPEYLMLLQFLALSGIILLLYGIYRQLSLFMYDTKGEAGPGFFLALLIFLVGMSFRLNARPEMMSHILTCAFIYILLLYRNNRSRWIFLLVPLQMLWANLHEGYGVGMVLLIIFNLVNWLEGRLFKKTRNRLSVREMRMVAGVSLLAILSTAVHPFGWEMIIHPFNIFGQLKDNQFTTELWSFKQKEYWQYPAFLALLAGGFGLYWLLRKRKPQRRIHLIPVFYVLILLAFLYLAMNAYRNIPFFLFVITPVLAVAFNRALRSSLFLKSIFVVSVLAVYALVGSGIFYRYLLPREKYGLKVDETSNPVGPAQFIKENNIGGNGFTDYISSSFLLWYLQPDFKTYLDLRDLDVFEKNFILNNLLVYQYPERLTKSGLGVFEFMDGIDNFNYVMLNNRFTDLHSYLEKNQKYELIYSDMMGTIYLKKNKRNEDILEKYKDVPVSERITTRYVKYPQPETASLISRIFWPFER